MIGSRNTRCSQIFFISFIFFISVLLCGSFLTPIVVSGFVHNIRIKSPPVTTNEPEHQNNSYQNGVNQYNGHQCNRNECEAIHLAFICGGYNSTRGLYTLLKSILFHRTSSKLELHLFVDDISHKILNQLFQTWQVSDLATNYYNVTKLAPQVSFIANEHYSGDYGTLKLAAPRVLADAGVRRAIFLDTDMLVLGDIAKLHSQFREHLDNFDQAYIGLVENQSDWYLDGNINRTGRPLAWPAIGRGFNTGVMLFDLEKLQEIDWDTKWRDVAWDQLQGGYLKTTLADQDVLNAVISVDPGIAVRLDCNYNLQLNDNTNLDASCRGHQRASSSEFRIIHWNSPYKLQTKNHYANYYRRWYEMFENFNADLFTSNFREPSSTYDHSGVPKSCEKFRPGLQDQLRTFLYYLDFQLDQYGQDEQVDVTLAVHLSFDRIRALDELADNWPGPISAAVYLRETELSSFRETIKDAETLAGRRNIAYHLAFKDQGQSYPINKLRNLALGQVLTPYVYLTDVDFLPAPHLYDYLKDVMKESQSKADKVAYVIAAFETKEYKFEFPQLKVDLIHQLDTGTVTTFRSDIWPQGQAATQYDDWKQATKPYETKWRPDYEPFIVTHKEVARFDERFLGFGWNKVQHAMLLAASGYKFQVLPEAFAIHQHHAASYDISMHRKSREYKSCINGLKKLFTRELHGLYPNFLNEIYYNLTAKGPASTSITTIDTTVPVS